MGRNRWDQEIGPIREAPGNGSGTNSLISFRLPSMPENHRPEAGIDYLYCNSSSAWFCLRRGRDSASSRGPVCSSHPSFPVAVSASVL